MSNSFKPFQLPRKPLRRNALTSLGRQVQMSNIFAHYCNGITFEAFDKRSLTVSHEFENLKMLSM